MGSGNMYSFVSGFFHSLYLWDLVMVVCEAENIHQNVHSSFVYSNQKLETQKKSCQPKNRFTNYSMIIL